MSSYGITCHLFVSPRVGDKHMIPRLRQHKHTVLPKARSLRPLFTVESKTMADQSFDTFLQEVREIEQKDSIYTSEKQIARLLRPGSSYANLNPFEVLLIEPETTPEMIRKQYKKLSILLHPDKNPENRDRAQAAFDVITKAYKALDDEAVRQKALDVVEEARFKVKQNMDEKRKKLRKEGKKDAVIEEDLEPEKYKQAIKVMTMKVRNISAVLCHLTNVLVVVCGLRA